MNRYEAIILDKMVNVHKAKMDKSVNWTPDEIEEMNSRILLLLECIVDFRDPPKELPVEDGCGAMAKKVEK